MSRFAFSNVTLPTRAAKRLKTRLKLKESLAREWTAAVFGYGTWNELQQSAAAQQSPFDEEMEADALRERHRYQEGRLAACIEKSGLPWTAKEILIKWRPTSKAPPREDDEPEVMPGLSSPDVKRILSAPEGTLFQYTMRNKWMTADCTNLAEFRQAFQESAAMMARWERQGIEYVGGAEDDYACFGTTSKAVALREGFNEIFGEND